MVPSCTSVHVVEAPQNGYHQGLCPQGYLQAPPPHSASPGDCLRPAGGSGPGAYQNSAFALGPGAFEILCSPFKSEVSISSSRLGLLKLSPAGLQSQMLWGLIFPVQDPQAGEPDMGLRTLTPGDFPGGAVVKNPPANARDTGSSPGPGRSHMPRSN